VYMMMQKGDLYAKLFNALSG